MLTIHADELQPGDVLVYDGYERRIIRVDRRDGWAWPIATDDSGWAVALDDHLVDVRRIAMPCRASRIRIGGPLSVHFKRQAVGA
jgi:hypothetical protein